jgi:hypothetical protein
MNGIDLNMYPKISSVLIVYSVAINCACAVEVNRCVDGDGKITFSDVPCPASASSAQKLKINAGKGIDRFADGVPYPEFSYTNNPLPMRYYYQAVPPQPPILISPLRATRLEKNRPGDATDRNSPSVGSKR